MIADKECLSCGLLIQQEESGSWVDQTNGDGCLQENPETEVHTPTI